MTVKTTTPEVISLDHAIFLSRAQNFTLDLRSEAIMHQASKLMTSPGVVEFFNL